MGVLCGATGLFLGARACVAPAGRDPRWCRPAMEVPQALLEQLTNAYRSCGPLLVESYIIGVPEGWGVVLLLPAGQAGP